MDDVNIMEQYNSINEANKELIDKKNELEFILNRYKEVISKIKIEDIVGIDGDEDKKLIETVQKVFKKGGEGNINDLIDTYVKTVMSEK